MANRIVPAWLERFITSEYAYPYNFFCVGCMQGACHAAEFQPGEAHAGHAYLQVRKHVLRNYVVNADDFTTFIDTDTDNSLNRYLKNGVSTFFLQARIPARVYERAPKLWSKTCAVCPEGLRSEQPGAIVCSIECLLRNSDRIPIVVKDSAPTGMLAPRRRSRWDERDRPRTPDVDDIHPAPLDEDFAADDELPTASDEAALPFVCEPIEALESESESFEVGASEEENEILEVGAPDRVTSTSAEQLWTKAKESAIDATFEQNTDFNWSNVVSVWSAGTYVRFLTSILSHKDQVNLEDGNEIPKVGAVGEETQTPKVGALREEAETPEVGALEEESEKPEAGGSFEIEGGVTSACAEKMWNQAKKAAIDATFEQDTDRDWGNVVSVWSAGTYVRFLTSILSCKNRESGVPLIRGKTCLLTCKYAMGM